MWSWPPFFTLTGVLGIELMLSGLHDKWLCLLGHLDGPKTIFEGGGIIKMGDWQFPIFLCSITNKHHMLTKWWQTICEWPRNLRDFQRKQKLSFAAEKRVKGVFADSISSLVGSSLDTERVLSEGFLLQEYLYYRFPQSPSLIRGLLTELLRGHVSVLPQRMSSCSNPHLGPCCCCVHCP